MTEREFLELVEAYVRACGGTPDLSRPERTPLEHAVQELVDAADSDDY